LAPGELYDHLLPVYLELIAKLLDGLGLVVLGGEPYERKRPPALSRDQPDMHWIVRGECRLDLLLDLIRYRTARPDIGAERLVAMPSETAA
jgi:hypothetical protein